MPRPAFRFVVATVLTTVACSTRGPGPGGPSGPDADAAAYRIVDAAAGRAIDLATLADRAATADVVFFGEQHDDAEAHRLQRRLLEAIASRRDHVVLSLEMFERDAQLDLNAYLAGRITEREFLEHARPWPNYATDYRPLVELAKARGWAVVAANVPRPIAAEVARGGLAALRTLPIGERQLAARDIVCPRDAYFERFVETMGEHPGTGEPGATVRRYYEAQCVKDETMAESIVAALAEQPGALVVHVTGAFHSDHGHGIPARVERRRPDAEIVILTAVPVEDPRRAGASADAHGGRADYVLFTRAAGEGAGG